jgi:hypothetical protein
LIERWERRIGRVVIVIIPWLWRIRSRFEFGFFRGLYDLRNRRGWFRDQWGGLRRRCGGREAVALATVVDMDGILARRVLGENRAGRRKNALCFGSGLSFVQMTENGGRVITVRRIGIGRGARIGLDQFPRCLRGPLETKSTKLLPVAVGLESERNMGAKGVMSQKSRRG